jgi:alanyl-tRNA synthetase
MCRNYIYCHGSQVSFGGKPDNARGGGKDASKLDEALAKAKTLLG